MRLGDGLYRRYPQAFALPSGWAQYQQEFTKYATQSLSRLQDGIVASFAGNKQKALDYLVNDPEGQRMWQRRSAELNAVATEVKEVTDQAVDYVTQVGKGLIQMDPETLKYAQRVVAGYGTLGTANEVDLNQLIKDSRILKKTMNRSEFVKDRITPGIAAHMQTLQQQGNARYEGGMWVLPSNTAVKRTPVNRFRSSKPGGRRRLPLR